MQQSSTRQFDAHMPPPSNNPASYQIGMAPPVSSIFEQPYQEDNKTLQMPFPNGASDFDRSCHFHHWQVPHVEYITDIQPNDGTYTDIVS